MFKKLLSLTLIFMLLFCLCACSGVEKDAEMRLPLSTEPEFLDPQVVNGTDARTVVLNCYDGLMRLDADGKAVPAAAKNVTVSSDGKVYTFTLDGKSKWHINSNHVEALGEDVVFEKDGEYQTTLDMTVSANDFVFGLRRALSPETKAPDAKRLFAIKNAAAVNNGSAAASTLGVEAVDGKTVRITLEYASADFLRMLAEPVAMPCMEKFFNACKGKYGMSAETVLCNGAFYLSRWYEAASIVLRRNPDNTRLLAIPYSVTFAFTNDSELIASKLAASEYDYAPIEAAMLNTITDAECTVTETVNGVFGMIFNCADPTTKNTALRLAICSATDFSLIQATEEMKATATGIIPPSCILGGSSFCAQATASGLPAFNETNAHKYFSQALSAAGVTDIDVGILCEASFETAARRMIQLWQKTLGIHFIGRIEIADSSQIAARLASGNYQIALTKITTSRDYAVDFLHSFVTGAQCNTVNFASKNYDTLVAQLTKAASDAELLKGCEKAQSYLVQNGVICPLFFMSSYYASPSSVSNVQLSPSGSSVILASAERSK